MRVTGHLCSVGYEEAARLGIDNLEHGPFAAPDGGLDPQREAGHCRAPRSRPDGKLGHGDDAHRPERRSPTPRRCSG